MTTHYCVACDVRSYTSAILCNHDVVVYGKPPRNLIVINVDLHNPAVLSPGYALRYALTT
jgi:hypothetical protein